MLHKKNNNQKNKKCFRNSNYNCQNMRFKVKLPAPGSTKNRKKKRNINVNARNSSIQLMVVSKREKRENRREEIIRNRLFQS